MRVNENLTGNLSANGYLFDAPIRNIRLTGHLICYERFGTINCHNLSGSLDITCKEDINKSANGTGGRGVHIYYGSKFFNLGTIIVENNEAQDTAVNNQAAIGIDGDGVLNKEMILEGIYAELLHIKNCRTNGILIQGINHRFKNVIIDNWGSDITNPLSAIPYMNYVDYDGNDIRDEQCAVFLHNTNAIIDNLCINQIGFAGRSKALTDVHIGRMPFDSDGDKYISPTINNLISLNPQGRVLTVGRQVRRAMAVVNNIEISNVSSNNVLVTDATLKSQYGLVHVDFANCIFGKIFCTNTNGAKLLKQTDRNFGGTDKQFINMTCKLVQCIAVPTTGTMIDISFNVTIDRVIGWTQTNNRVAYINV